jgi:hypothetical protein
MLDPRMERPELRPFTGDPVEGGNLLAPLGPDFAAALSGQSGEGAVNA